MKYLESFELFERVIVPDIETSRDKNDSRRCGNCLVDKSGKPLISPPPQTFQGLDNYQNLNRPPSLIKDLDLEIQKFFKAHPEANGLINQEFNSSKKWYTEHYSKPETLQKFKNKVNRDKLVNFINKEIKLGYWNRNSLKAKSNQYKDYEISKNWEKDYSQYLGWVWTDRPDLLNLNMEQYNSDWGYKETIPHEMGHSIYLKLEELGEDPISGNKDAATSIAPNFTRNNVNPSLSDREKGKIEKMETYLTDEMENQTRLMKLRKLMNIGAKDTCEQIKQKFERDIKNGNLKFRYLIPSGFVKNKNGDCYWLKLKVSDDEILGLDTTAKEFILDKNYFIEGKPRLYRIYQLLNDCTFKGRDMIDFPRLFSIFSQYKDGFIWLDLSKITQLNIDVVTNDSPDDFNKMA